MDYEILYKEMFEFIKKIEVMTLSTYFDDRLSSRSMSVVFIEDKLYFQTSKKSRKYSAIINNPRIALSIDNVQIEALAIEVGSPMSNGNKKFINEFKRVHKGSYDVFSSLEEEVVFKVTISNIRVWKYIEGVPIIECLDILNKKGYVIEQNFVK